MPKLEKGMPRAADSVEEEEASQKSKLIATKPRPNPRDRTKLAHDEHEKWSLVTALGSGQRLQSSGD
jgi:hypothetical protein